MLTRYLVSLALMAAPALAQSLPHAITDGHYAPVRLEEARLGQMLFYDAVLSGNRNISCATCHHPRFATGDGVSLGLGEGGMGLGPDRRVNPDTPPEQRIPRHAQALFNLGAKEFTVLFHDGRIEVDPSRKNGLRTPLEDDMTHGFASLLSAQTMFPVLSQDEMAGHYSENDVSRAVRQGNITGPGGAWSLLAARIAEIPAYQRQFSAVYPRIKAGKPIGFTDISNAIAAFIAHEWRSDTSPFDASLRGADTLEPDAIRGRDLFYGRAQCDTCHAGPFQTDHAFHAMGVPQFGPGKTARFENHARDTGRQRVTGRDRDAHAFRTPSLRNVTRTAPYGHTGAYRDLHSFIRAHIIKGHPPYDKTHAILPALDVPDWWVLDRPNEVAAINAAATFEVALSGADIHHLIAFLKTLEDPVALGGRLGIPPRVPSGLPVEH